MLRRVFGHILGALSGMAAVVASEGCSPALPPTPAPPPDVVVYYGYEVANVFPHDREAFTQGLAFSGGCLYEGTGLHGASSIRKVELETGRALLMRQLPRAHFGEGIALHNNRLIQLTWRSQVGFVYDVEGFEPRGDFNYVGEGWGITHDGSRFIMSDGTARLRFLDVKTFQEVGHVYVRFGDRPISNLNELEYIDGYVYANIWKEERIAVICPDSGCVAAWIDLSGLLTAEERRAADVLNGIAWDASGERLFVTGKRWPKLFEITLVEQGRIPYPGKDIEGGSREAVEN